MLHNDVLLHIFEFYVAEDTDTEKWITLVHVCRLWRSLVSQSPRRLNLQLSYPPNKWAMDILDIWPPLPLIIHDDFTTFSGESSVENPNTIAAVKHILHKYRVSQIKIHYHQILDYIVDLAEMQRPFPELTHLRFRPYTFDGPILLDSFLGGSTPRLRSLVLFRIPFPALLNLLLSTTHLVNLELYDVPPLGYIPPELMATSLSALTRLNLLHLHFRFPNPHPILQGRCPPPLTRSILPNLTTIQFRGSSEYLEDILARIDAPRTNELCITFFNQFMFDTPQLFQFISRRLTLSTPVEKGRIRFCSNPIVVKFWSQTSDCVTLVVEIPCSDTCRGNPMLGFKIAAAFIFSSGLHLVLTLYFHIGRPLLPK